MDIAGFMKKFENCPCGHKHEQDIKIVEIGSGKLEQCADILKAGGFPEQILVVTDKNELKASEGILEILERGGFKYRLKLYENLREANDDEVQSIVKDSEGCDGIFSIGSGSCNDICRMAAYLAEKEFAIFATAPSMDGFAASTAPITKNNFKSTMQAKQPSIIIADTAILAASPVELKAAGFGDILAKFIALADWRISNLLTGEYYCENCADSMRSVLEKLISLADKVCCDDEETAGAIMEALVISGMIIKLAGTSRPVSGAEHIISHFMEIKKLEKGQLSDYHGKKVGIGTLYAVRMYYKIIAQKPVFTEDRTDWDEVYGVYGKNFESEIREINTPPITDGITPEKLESCWERIVEIVKEEVPTPEQIEIWMDQAGAPKTLESIDVDREMGLNAVKYSSYMRPKITLSRLRPMLNVKLDYDEIIDGNR